MFSPRGNIARLKRFVASGNLLIVFLHRFSQAHEKRGSITGELRTGHNKHLVHALYQRRGSLLAQEPVFSTHHLLVIGFNAVVVGGELSPQRIERIPTGRRGTSGELEIVGREYDRGNDSPYVRRAFSLAVKKAFFLPFLKL